MFSVTYTAPVRSVRHLAHAALVALHRHLLHRTHLVHRAHRRAAGGPRHWRPGSSAPGPNPGPVQAQYALARSTTAPPRAINSVSGASSISFLGLLEEQLDVVNHVVDGHAEREHQPELSGRIDRRRRKPSGRSDRRPRCPPRRASRRRRRRPSAPARADPAGPVSAVKPPPKAVGVFAQPGGRVALGIHGDEDDAKPLPGLARVAAAPG